jgi:hypothetical protein
VLSTRPSMGHDDSSDDSFFSSSVGQGRPSHVSQSGLNLMGEIRMRLVGMGMTVCV